MDEEEKLKQTLQHLNQALEWNSPGEIQKCTDDFNRYMQLREMFATKGSSGNQDLGSGFMNSMARVVRDKGVRLPALERAFHCDKVVLGGSIDIKHNALDAIKGHEPFKVHIEGATLQLKCTF